MTAVAEFWGRTVLDGPYATVEDSNEALVRRKEMFPGLYELMPITGFARKSVLDFGCGPGHDTVLFAMGGAKVFYADISAKARRITYDRLKLHGIEGKTLGLPVRDTEQVVGLPSVDHVHCAGVLHHTSHPDAVLRALRGALNPGAELRLMVYDGELSEHSQSKVPITQWWTPAEVLAMASAARLSGSHVGSYPCSSPWRPNCYAACYAFTAE